MQQEQIRFIVTNDPKHDFDLMLEAYKGDELVADVRPLDSDWTVRFFAQDVLCEIPWEDFMRIQKTFSQFIAEMAVPGEVRRRRKMQSQA